MLRCLNRADISGEIFQCGTEGGASFPEYPPVFFVSETTILIPFRLYVIVDPLVDLGESAPDLLDLEAEQVDDHYVARGAGEVATIQVRADVSSRPGVVPNPSFFATKSLRHSVDQS